ncbi:MAG: hypothetical protein K9G48_13820 [Reyranella sp.]|nr:hypothetical protein [Reyranella sp.]
MPFLWVCTMLASVVGGLVFAGGMLGAKSAPQEAAVAAMGLCIAIIPYIFTRAIEGIGQAKWRRDMLAELKKQAASAPRPS